MNYDNPPAFPIPEVRTDDGIGISEGAPGMSLRDWFAGQTLPAIISQLYSMGRMEGPLVPTIAAEFSYEVADAMLAARKGSRTCS